MWTYLLDDAIRILLYNIISSLLYNIISSIYINMHSLTYNKYLRKLLSFFPYSYKLIHLNDQISKMIFYFSNRIFWLVSYICLDTSFHNRSIIFIYSLIFCCTDLQCIDEIDTENKISNIRSVGPAKFVF